MKAGLAKKWSPLVCFSMASSSSPDRSMEHQEIFCDIYCKNLAKLLEVKLTREWSGVREPQDSFHSTFPHLSSTSSTMMADFPTHH
jgi:hypothetical protein